MVLDSDAEYVELRVRRADLDTLLRLRDAGVLPSLDGGLTYQVDPALIDWTYEDLAKHMSTVQRLKLQGRNGRQSTISEYQRKLRQLENHPEVPVLLRPPDEQSYLDHLHYREGHGGISNAQKNHQRKALKSLLKFLGIPQWQSLEDRYPEPPPERPIPPDDLVPHFWTSTRHPNRYTQDTMQYVNHWAFGAGPRAPSEHVDLELDWVEWDARTVKLWEEKKRRFRVLSVPTYLITGRNSKSLLNYVEHVRPRVDKGESGAFWLNRYGRRWGHGNFQQIMSYMGKQVWSDFYPYCSRHWFATTFLRDNEYNVYRTADAIGDTVKVAEGYLNQARIRESWAEQGLSGFVRRRRRVSAHAIS